MKKENTGKLLVKGSFLRTTELVANCVVSLFMMPFFIHTLGNRMYGFWLLIGSFFGFYGFLDLGLSSAAQRYLAKDLGKKDFQEINYTFNTFFFVFLIIGVVAFLVSILSFFLAHFFISNETDLEIFKKIAILLGINVVISFPMRIFNALFAAHLKWHINNYIELFSLCIRTILIVFFLSNGYKIFSLAVITFIIALLGNLLRIVLAFKVASYLKISKNYIKPSYIKRYFKYSSNSFIIQLMSNIRYNIDNFIITAFMGLNAVTIYSIASRLLTYYGQFMTSAVGMLTPLFSQYEGKQDFHSIREKFGIVSTISSYLSLFIGGGLVIFGKPFIERWVGNEYHTSYQIMLIMIIPSIVNYIQIPSNNVMYGISKHRYLSLQNTLEAICNIIISLILVRKLGLFGVALGTAIPMIISRVFIQPAYVCHIIGLSIKDYYIGLVIPIILRASLFLLTFYLISYKYIQPNYLNIISIGFLFSLLFIGMIYFSKDRNILQKVAATFYHK